MAEQLVRDIKGCMGAHPMALSILGAKVDYKSRNFDGKPKQLKKFLLAHDATFCVEKDTVALRPEEDAEEERNNLAMKLDALSEKMDKMLHAIKLSLNADDN